VWPAGPEPIITSFECIPLSPIGVVLRDGVAEVRAGVAACFWFKNAAAARGKPREERRGKRRVRRNAEANSLTVVASFAGLGSMG
jgi:hypothetical protein